MLVQLSPAGLVAQGNVGFELSLDSAVGLCLLQCPAAGAQAFAEALYLRC